MFLKKLELSHFRNYSHLCFDVPERLLIVGPNGEGKTNILEALSLLIQGRSFRVSEPHAFVQNLYKKSSVNAEFVFKENHHDLRLTLDLEGKKHLFFNQKPTSHYMLQQKIALILFGPESLLLLKEGAEGRRRWMDQWLKMQGQGACVAAFRKVWEQKNSLLMKIKKGKMRQREGIKWMESLNPLFVQKSLDLSQSRRKALKSLEEFFYQKAGALLHKKGRKFLLREELEICYLGHSEGLKKEQSLLNRVEQGLLKEVERGFCLYGAHREDFQICYKKKDSRYYSSQGEQRAFLLALKQAQVQWIHQFQDRPVIWLLDDVFSEIDKHLIQNLLHFIKTICAQVIFTSTFTPDFPDKGFFTVFFLKKGTLLRK